MSARAMRKLLQAQQANNAPTVNSVEYSESEESEGENDGKVISTAQNLFSMLNVEEEVEEEEESDTDNAPKEPVPIKQAKGKNRKKKKPAAKKKQNHIESSEEEFPNEYLDQILRDENSTNPENIRKTLDSILIVSSQKLDADTELKRIFGSETVGAQGKRSKRFPGKYLLCAPNDFWPAMDRIGLSMETDDSFTVLNGSMGFTYNHSLEYQKIECQFINMHSSILSPEAIGHFNSVHGGHSGCHLLLSFVACQTGDFHMSNEYLSRCLYTLERSFDPKFRFTTDKKAATSAWTPISYNKHENRVLFLALFHRVTLLQRKGCWATAFEVAKALLRLDPVGDPLAVWCLVDFLALRCEQYGFLLDLYHNCEEELDLAAIFPGWAFSVAIAKFMTELPKKVNNESYQPSTDLHSESLEMLALARSKYPGLFVRILEGVGLPCDSVDNETDKDLDPLLCDLYLMRMLPTFKQSLISKWLLLAPASLTKEDSEPVMSAHSEERKQSIYRHAYLVDWTNSSTNAAATSALTKHIPERLRSGPNSKTPWGVDQMTIMDPFPPCLNSKDDITPVSPYDRYFVRRLIQRYPLQIIPELMQFVSSYDTEMNVERMLIRFGFDPARETLPFQLPATWINMTAVDFNQPADAGVMAYLASVIPPFSWMQDSLDFSRAGVIDSLNTEELEYWLTEHLRLSGVYWGLTCLFLLGREDALNRQDVIEYVKSCQCQKTGGFGGHRGYDAHLLYTLSAIQILVMYDALDHINVDKVVEFVAGLQREDGSFMGDEWEEIDTRFSYCALACLSLLGRLDSVDVDKAVVFIDRCRNFDGGFGSVPGAESHAGQIFCCVGALAVVGRLDSIIADSESLCRWLSERQLAESGGLNGRPEKLADVCYSWWVLSSLDIMGRLEWIDAEGLKQFILQCQDDEAGGIADRPGDVSDVFHTLFGIAGLSLLGYEGLEKVDPVYCMPARTIAASDNIQKFKLGAN